MFIQAVCPLDCDFKKTIINKNALIILISQINHLNSDLKCERKQDS